MPFNQKEYMRNYIRSRYHNDPIFRANQKRYVKEGRRKITMEIFNLLGNKCNNPLCSTPRDKLDSRCLQIDHVNGGGKKEKREFETIYYRHILRKIQSGSKDYQLLCANCNVIKRYKNKEN